MRTLILDQYARQPFPTQFLGYLLTGLAWAFWVYLWLPLIAAIVLLLGAHPEQATSAASRSILELAATLSAHAVIVVIMIAGFIAWSVLQWAGRHHRDEALQKQHANTTSDSPSVARMLTNIKPLQQVQRMVISHDEVNGAIYHVEILYSKHKDSCSHHPGAKGRV